MSFAGNCHIPYYFGSFLKHPYLQMQNMLSYRGFHVGDDKYVIMQGDAKCSAESQKKPVFLSVCLSRGTTHQPKVLVYICRLLQETDNSSLFCDVTSDIRLYYVSPVVVLPLPWMETQTVQSHGEQQGYKGTL